MKTYPDEEYIKARENLPRPIADFLSSDALTGIYVGIAKKLKLNLRQADAMSTIINATLLGLEPEHALEHNLHQELPELSNEKTRELVADINDRIFKEATRRLRENIITQEEWDEATFGPKDTYRPPVSDTEARKLVEAERKAKAEKPTPVDTKSPTGESPAPVPQPASPQPQTAKAQEPGSTAPPAPGIAKLQETVTTKPEEVIIAEPPPKSSSGSAQQTRATDPYRETIE